MSPWDKKLQQFESLLEQKLSDHKATVDTVRIGLSKHAEDAAGVQTRMLLEFALCQPPLASVPEGLQFDTVFDIIKFNVVESFMEFGMAYLDNHEET